MKSTENTYTNASHFLDLIQTEAHGLSKWEEDFIDSVAEQLVKRRSLSDRQFEILERIYAEKTS
jgi:hypothetical protein